MRFRNDDYQIIKIAPDGLQEPLARTVSGNTENTGICDLFCCWTKRQVLVAFTVILSSSANVDSVTGAAALARVTQICSLGKYCSAIALGFLHLHSTDALKTSAVSWPRLAGNSLKWSIQNFLNLLFFGESRNVTAQKLPVRF